MNTTIPTTTPVKAQYMTGGEALVASLKRWNVDVMFGMPGVQLDDLFDALQRTGDGINVIHTRHEQGAAYMALGYAVSTGNPGVFTVVPGPGILNAGAALSTAYAVSAPVLCLTSTVWWNQIDRNNGALHEIRDQIGILQRLCKWAARANHPGEIPQLVDEAFRQMKTGRPQPVALEIPPEILAQSALVMIPENLPSLENPAPDPRSVAAAIELLETAQNPLIVVGSGAQEAGAAVQALAEYLQAPVISRQLGRGVLSDRHDLALTAAAGHHLWADADVVIGIGTRLQQLREWGNDADLKVIRIDLDPMEITRVDTPAVKLLADAAEATIAIVEGLKARNSSRPDRTTFFRAIKEKFRTDVAATIQPQVGYLDVIREELPDNGVLVDEMTQVGFAAKYAYPIYSKRSFVCSGYQGTLGYGFATAMGAQAADSKRRVVSITGDGGFMYNVQELSTAVLHKIPLVTIIFADGNFGNVRRIQTNKFKGRYIASNLHNPDFAQLAELFGAVGLRAETPEDLRTALRTAFASERPVLIEVPMDIDTVASPWKYVHLHKVR